MYFWQLIILICAIAFGGYVLLRPQDDPLAKRLRTLMIWGVPYLFITMGLCALFLQAAYVAVIFLVGAGACFLLFLKRDIR